ncbi:hypothetical protein BJX63DRAFT_182448 [Aspergillus granulosus]|uniref:Uncharacterized protein n=1 Tax=Aspergillus granulosus TaxID=176169 RepID=A0ABR4I2V3_9EURO
MSDNENPPSERAQAKLAEWERNMAQIKEEHPEWNIDLENKWWVPLVDHQEDMDSLNKETRDKYSAWAVRFLEIKYDPERLPAMREELKTILAGYPEIEEKAEKLLFNERALTRARKYVVAEMETGREPFPDFSAK